VNVDLILSPYMKAYSLDFRQKILDVYRKENLSQRELAEWFDVALSFIIKILKQQRETGDIAPKPHGGGNPALLRSEHYKLIAELIETKNDMTISELCTEFQQRLQLKVCRSTMGRALQKLQLQRKKNFSGN
jgi:transposase